MKLFQRIYPKTLANQIAYWLVLGTVVFVIASLICEGLLRSKLQSIGQELSQQRLKAVANVRQAQAILPGAFLKSFGPWDDMVEAIGRRDCVWIDKQLSPYTANYDVDAFWVTNKQGEVLFSKGNSEVDDHNRLSKDLLVPNASGRFKVRHFFAWGPTGLIEYFTSPITLTNDAKGEGQHYGYLVVATAWTENLRRELESKLSAEVRITRTPMVKGLKGKVEVPFQSETGSYVAFLSASYPHDLAETAAELSHTLLLILLAAGLITFTVLFFVIRKMSLVPLEKMSKAISEQDLQEIAEFEHLDNELGHLVRLLRENDNQRADISRINQELNDLMKQRTQSMLSQKGFNPVSQMAAGLAHEINNPIQFIAGNLVFLRKLQTRASLVLGKLVGIALQSSTTSELAIEASKVEGQLQEGLDAISEVQAGVRKISDSIEALHLLINKKSDAFVEVDINRLVLQTANAMKPRLEGRANLDLDLAPDAGLVMGRHDELSSAVFHLIENAATALDELSAEQEKTISISTRRDGEMCKITVKDNGPGIPENCRDKVFEPFFTTRDRSEASGLGLSIVERIVADHGGTAVVGTPEIGASLTLVLPHRAEGQEAA